MATLLEKVFDLLTANPITRILGATLLGSVVILLSVSTGGFESWRSALNWAIGGGLIGMVAALLLSWPRAFPGATCLALGLFTILCPMSRADGSPLTVGIHLIKIGLGCVFLGAGATLLLWARRVRKREYDRMAKIQSVAVSFALSDGDYGSEEERSALQSLAGLATKAVSEGGVATYDGDEYGGGRGTLYFHGEDARAIWHTLQPLLARHWQFRSVEATLRFDGWGREQETLELG